MKETYFKNRYILIYPHKFVDTLYSIYGLNDFSNDTEVIVYDISKIINKDFSQSTKAPSTLNNVKQLDSLKAFILVLKDIKEQSIKQKICINYLVPPGTIIGLIVDTILYFYLKNTEVKILITNIAGFPLGIQASKKLTLIDKIRDVSSIKQLIKKIYAFIWKIAKIQSPVRFLVTHKLITGDYHRQIEINTKQNCKLLYGQSLDFDRYLSLNNQKSEFDGKKIIVFLDEPGPMFASDYRITGEKVHKTIDVWYPTLCKFFDKIESIYNSRVVIAAHYKSAFTSPSEVFGGREVFYGRTIELIKNSILVVTEQSTAVSFAIIYKIPIMYIFSEESRKDLPLIRFIESMTGLLGQAQLNINFLETIPKSLPVIDTRKYLKYQNLYLTSENEKRTNAQIIEQEILI